MNKNRLEDRIFTYSDFLKKKYNRKIFRVGLSLGIPCPHRMKNEGCIFCDPQTFTGSYQSKGLSITEQLEIAIPIMEQSCGNVDFLAYFQDETSTAGSIDFLMKKFEEALQHPKIAGLVISTRPDFIDDDIIDLLQRFKVSVTIEIGLQSIHDKSLRFLNRGHNFDDTKKAIKKCGEAGLEIGVHIIIGIPGEKLSDMIETIKYISSEKSIKQIKFHNLVVYKNTKLAEIVSENKTEIMTISDYLEILLQLLINLRGDIAVSRLFTSNVQKNQIAVNEIWGNKTKWMNELRKKMIKNDLFQGMNTNFVYNKNNG
ncbi:MAG: TIGR01212 family radical SAM protein [Candidatus Cloacimonetes bacterium]|nr:TIGR01212 family radical SAM protein [Candidatus Cloacimonadota bacterium]